jgi:hypothetical protein
MTDKRRKRKSIPMTLAGIPFKTTGQRGVDLNTAAREG